jgi:hypothetical protein
MLNIPFIEWSSKILNTRREIKRVQRNSEQLEMQNNFLLESRYLS